MRIVSLKMSWGRLSYLWISFRNGQMACYLHWKQQLWTQKLLDLLQTQSKFPSHRWLSMELDCCRWSKKWTDDSELFLSSLYRNKRGQNKGWNTSGKDSPVSLKRTISTMEALWFVKPAVTNKRNVNWIMIYYVSECEVVQRTIHKWHPGG